MGFDPKALGDEVTTLRDTVLRSMERNEASSLNGFIRVYGFLCDYLGVPISEEIPWVWGGVGVGGRGGAGELQQCKNAFF